MTERRPLVAALKKYIETVQTFPFREMVAVLDWVLLIHETCFTNLCLLCLNFIEKKNIITTVEYFVVCLNPVYACTRMMSTRTTEYVLLSSITLAFLFLCDDENVLIG